MNPQKDDTVYSIQGQEGTYISPFNGGHLVAPHYENPDGGMVLDAPEQWKEVFSKPPTAVLEKDVAKLSAQIAEMASRVTELRTQEREARQAFDVTCKRLKGYEPLKNVVDFLDGKMTHVVVIGNYHKTDVSVLTVEETIAEDSSDSEYRNGKWTKPLKLLCLHGNKKPERLEWRMYGYSDGSGEGRMAYPFASEEEAKKKAQELLAPFLDNWSNTNSGSLIDAIVAAQKIGLPIPDGALAKIEESKIADLKERVADAEKKLEQQRQLLANACE